MEPDHEQKRHKKSKRKHRHDEDEDPTAVEKMEIDDAPASTKKDKKKNKHSKHQDKIDEIKAEDGGDAAEELDNIEPAAKSPEKKHKRHKSETKKEKKHSKKSSKHERSSLSPSPSPPPSAQPDTTTTNNNHTAVVPDDKQYPFFTQTFSQRIPVWPAAFDEPLTKTAHEYLDPMLNRYSPKFKGVLLAYKNVNLSHRPQRASAVNPPTNDTPVVLESFECYAPPFAWLTADLHLFVPSRGAWMEGEINLQSEGHIGVVCFEKFNASISRKSLPRGWQFVEQEEADDSLSGDAESFGQEQQEGGEGGEQNEDGEEAAETKAQSTPRLRSTGYWVDENGDKVDGKIYFRIKNFSSGSTGDYTYLSLQGTMLDDEAERKIATEEREAEKARRARSNPNGLLYPTMRLPESSMTKLKDITV